MPTIKVFRAGSSFSLDPLPGAETLHLRVQPDVAVRRSAVSGRQLLYRDPGPYGQSVAAAIQLGWAQIDAAAEAPDV